MSRLKQLVCAFVIWGSLSGTAVAQGPVNASAEQEREYDAAFQEMLRKPADAFTGPCATAVPKRLPQMTRAQTSCFRRRKVPTLPRHSFFMRPAALPIVTQTAQTSQLRATRSQDIGQAARAACMRSSMRLYCRSPNEVTNRSRSRSMAASMRSNITV